MHSISVWNASVWIAETPYPPYPPYPPYSIEPTNNATTNHPKKEAPKLFAYGKSPGAKVVYQ